MYFNICTFILQNIIQIWKHLTLTEKCYNYPQSPLHVYNFAPESATNHVEIHTSEMSY